MAKINVLSKDVYSLIAAGEVADRPMSVVKEMIENSIDAEAKHITVEIKNGGTTYIRVTDDGSGILRDDMRNVFTPHATSKIANEDDLNSIETLGFRGEAMASIAAVSKIDVMSRVSAEEIGARYVIEGGVEKSFEDAGCPLGTTIVVRDIFYNVPARMKFLKKDVTEGNSVQNVVERIALSHPEISFRFIRDNKQAVITSGNNSLKDCIYSVLGDEISDSMIEVNYSFDNMKVYGYVCKPYATRKSRSAQFFYINGRYVQSKTMMASLEQAYKNVSMVGRFPACVLNISMNYSMVDVNVHPSKMEVKFVNERSIFNLVYYGVKSAIEERDTIKEINLPETKKEENNIKIDYFKKAPSSSQMKFSTKRNTDFWQYSKISEVKSPQNDKTKGSSEDEVSTPIRAAEHKFDYNDADIEIVDEDSEQSIKIIGEAFETYIIVQMDNDLYYIDKHAAHERMNYEQLRSTTEINSQVLLQSEAVQLSTEEYIAITENIDLINKCGFLIEDFGNNSVIVREVPAMLDIVNIKDLILEIAEKLIEHKTDIEPEKMDWIFHSASCRSAVKAGDHMSETEMELFVKKLFSMPNIRYCPHGRPVVIKISKHELEKQFGRIQ